MALQYTQLRQHLTIPTLIRPNNKIATIMNTKKALIRVYIFSQPPMFLGQKI